MQKQDVYELIKKYSVGMITNINEDGKLVSHPMTRQGELENDILWFFSKKDSEKIKELRKNDCVNVSFAGEEYISVSGHASIVEDAATKKGLWSSELKAFFDGPTSEDMVLIKVAIDSIECWASDNVFKTAFEFAKAMVTDQSPDMGKNQAMDI